MLKSTLTSYPEAVSLRDGRKVAIWPVTPAAKPLIAAAMAGLSERSSRQRFFSVRYRLSEAELDRMTALDGYRAFALGAVERKCGALPRGVGVARFARDDGDPTSAEMAVLVVDDYQRAGLGTALVTRLVNEAHARGIEQLRALVLPDNDVVLAMLAKYAPSIAVERHDDGLRAAIPTHLAPRPARAPAFG
jgi:GNAT superfamily N-acetyltransferase